MRINTSKENYDADYEIGGIQTFINKLKSKKLREIEKENEELQEKIIKDREKNSKNKYPSKTKNGAWLLRKL